MVAADPSTPGTLCGTNEVVGGQFANGVYWSTVNFCAKTDLSDLRIVKTGGDGRSPGEC